MASCGRTTSNSGGSGGTVLNEQNGSKNGHWRRDRGMIARYEQDRPVCDLGRSGKRSFAGTFWSHAIAAGPERASRRLVAPGRVRLYAPGHDFLGVGNVLASGKLAPERLFAAGS